MRAVLIVAMLMAGPKAVDLEYNFRWQDKFTCDLRNATSAQTWCSRSHQIETLYTTTTKDFWDVVREREQTYKGVSSLELSGLVKKLTITAEAESESFQRAFSKLRHQWNTDTTNSHKETVDMTVQVGAGDGLRLWVLTGHGPGIIGEITHRVLDIDAAPLDYGPSVVQLDLGDIQKVGPMVTDLTSHWPAGPGECPTGTVEAGWDGKSKILSCKTQNPAATITTETTGITGLVFYYPPRSCPVGWEQWMLDDKAHINSCVYKEQLSYGSLYLSYFHLHWNSPCPEGSESIGWNQRSNIHYCAAFSKLELGRRLQDRAENTTKPGLRGSSSGNSQSNLPNASADLKSSRCSSWPDLVVGSAVGAAKSSTCHAAKDAANIRCSNAECMGCCGFDDCDCSCSGGDHACFCTVNGYFCER